MHPLSHANRAEMNAQPRGIWHEARDLFADDEIGRVRMPIEELEAAVDAVVVGDAHEIHAARLGHTVDVLGRRVAFTCA